jgi:hypothetical protein
MMPDDAELPTPESNQAKQPAEPIDWDSLFAEEARETEEPLCLDEFFAEEGEEDEEEDEPICMEANCYKDQGICPECERCPRHCACECCECEVCGKPEDTSGSYEGEVCDCWVCDSCERKKKAGSYRCELCGFCKKCCRDSGDCSGLT